jgi:hypothetical protein
VAAAAENDWLRKVVVTILAIIITAASAMVVFILMEI